MDFIKPRKIWFFLSTCLIIFSIFSLITKGLNFGIDFTGGSSLMLRFKDKVVIEKVRKAISREKTEVTLVENDYLIKTSVLTLEEKTAFLKGIENKLGAFEVLEDDTIGPSIGKELSDQSLLILVLALAGMLVYVTFRFEFWYGLAAILALVHDGIITMGFAAWWQLDINASIIAAILTILGYSINDTIIVFDRIREEMKHQGKDKPDIAVVTNAAINSTMARCINTILTTLFAVVALFLFGGSSIKEFAQILIVGFVFGFYSSVFVASPLYVVFKKAQE